MKNKSPLYPLKFYPQLKEKVWGGEKLVRFPGKEGKGQIGESWELSAVEGSISMVSNGAFKGMALDTLIQEFGASLLGKKIVEDYGKTFPLLFKFIDAKQDLSVQLHPNDQIAQKRHNSFGKTEMWYILQADKDARLILGFNKAMDKESYLQHLSKGTLTQILHEEPVKKGDAFFISPGTVHAIGAGILLAEIQQTSDITYRIYDWDRPDVNGQMRTLHTQESLDVIDFSRPRAKLQYSPRENESVLLCQSPYFVTSTMVLTQDVAKEYPHIDSFVVYMCVDGAAAIRYNGHVETLQAGETLLIPACLTQLTIETQRATILEVYVP